MAAKLDWLIVGGGIHGVHLAVRLLAEGGVDRERLRILDPAPRLLDRWRRCSANTGLRYLRSPAVHHLDVEPWSLLRFSGASDSRGRDAPKGAFAPPYNRPSTELFERHCDTVIEQHGLAELHLRASATRMDLVRGGARVETATGESLRARRVLLAIGSGDQPRWPEWTGPVSDAGHRIEHIFAPGFELAPDAWPDRVAVVGGGISAAQAALRLADAGRDVQLVARHELRKDQFDSDPGWLGPKHMRRFAATRDFARRRSGSMPPDVFRALKAAITDGSVGWSLGEPRPELDDGALTLRVGADSIPVDAVVLATGFEGRRPGGALVDDVVQRYHHPCAECGYPVVDAGLRWHRGLYVTGPLAELELGPAARNIAGARKAADRLVRA